MSNRRWAIRVLLCMLIVVSTSLFGWELDSVDKAETHAAALNALSSVPPPLVIVTDVRDVPAMANTVESKGLALQANIENLESAMVDLGAQVLEQEIRVSLAADVLFDFDQHDLRSEAETELEGLALIVREKASGSVRIEGHTDAKGSHGYNQALSERRANSVKKWLLDQGDLGPGLRFETTGWGETKPVAPNLSQDGGDYPEGRALNRRVEVFIETTESFK